MWSRMGTWLAPPRFEDEARSTRAVILNGVMLVSLLALGIGLVIALLRGAPAPLALTISGLLVGLLLPHYLLMRRGYINTVSASLVGALWLTLTTLAVLLEGVNGPIPVAYVLLVVIAALLTGPNGGLLVSALVIASVLSLAYSGQNDWLPEPLIPTEANDVAFSLVMVVIVTTLFIFLATRTLQLLLVRAQKDSEALRASLDRLRQTSVSKDYFDNIIQSMSNLLIVLDTRGRIQSVNQTTLDLLGYTEGELLGQSFNTKLLADAEQDMSATRLMQINMVRNVDQVYRTKDGRQIPVLLASSIMYDDDGAPQGVVCVAQDISDRRAAESQLKYQAGLLDSVSDAIIATSMDLTITSWNAAASRLYGYSADEVIGKNLLMVIPTRYPDGEQADLIKKQYMARGHWQSEVMQRRRDGSMLHVLSSIALIRDDAGRPTGTVTINHDITKRKQAETAMKRRSDQLNLLRQVDVELSSTLDIERVLTMALSAAMTMAGGDAGFILLKEGSGYRRTTALGRYRHLKPGPSELTGIMARVAENRAPEMVVDLSRDVDYAPDLPDTVEVMAFPLTSQERLLGLLNIEGSEPGRFSRESFDLIGILMSRIAVAVENANLYDVAQRQVTELQELYAQVSRLEQVKTDMIRIASHDLRNPVGIINGYIQLLKLDIGEIANAEQMDYIDQIDKQVRRMDDIATNLLSLERIREVANDTFTEYVDLWTLTQRAALNHTREARHKGLGLSLDVQTDILPLNVKGDHNQLYEGVVNFITNAIKYTPQGGHISVLIQQNGTEVRVSVTDTGIGIPREQQERLFQPFYRVESEAAARIDGVGLGLHLVKNIIERHNGQVFVESAYGEGSTFGFDLPLYFAEDSAAAEGEPSSA